MKLSTAFIRNAIPLSLLLFLSVCVRGTVLPIQVVGSTQTQITVNYTATTSAACTLTVTDNNNGPSVNDVDGTKFTGANLDLSRTVANGFRWPTLVNGLNRTVFLGGHDEVKQGLDTAWYSTALQVNSDHTITVYCNGGADIGTVHAQTQNIPLGSYYPELMIPQLSFRNEGSWPTPTIDYSMAGANTAYIDPISGVLIKLASHATDNFTDFPGNSFERGFFTSSTALLDPTNSWTTPGNAAAPSGFPAAAMPTSFATTSTTNAVLFLPLAVASDYNWQAPDFNIRLFGSGASGAEIVTMCISIDGGQTCATGTIDVPMSTTSQCQTYLANAATCEGVPNARKSGGVFVYTGSSANFPTPYFSGWGGGCKNAHCGAWEMYNSVGGTIGNVSVSGSTLTSNNNSRPGFNPARPSGTPYWLSGCSVGGPTALVHSATVDAYNQMTLQESGLNLSGCTLTEAGTGIRIVLKNSGTVHLAARLYLANPGGAIGNSDAVRWFCARDKATATTDCDGNSRTIKTTLCKLDGAGIYSLQDDGRICLQSNGFGGSKPVNIANSPWASATSLFTLSSDQTTLFRMDHIAGDYSRYDPGQLHTLGAADKFTYVNLGTPNINSLILASAGNADMKAAINSGLFDGPGLNTVCDYSGGAALEWNWTAHPASNGGLPMKAWTDASTGNLLGAVAFWNQGNGLTSAGAHSPAFCIAGFSETGVINLGQPSPMFYNAAMNLGGPFVAQGSGLHDGTGGFHSYAIPSISTISNSSPAVMTFSTSPDLSGIRDYESRGNIQTTCSGFTGTWAALNTMLYLFATNSTTYSIYTDARNSAPVDSTGFGSYAGQTPTCTAMAPIYVLQVTSVTNNGGNVRLNMTTPSYGKFTSGRLPVQDKDPVALLSLDLTHQYYTKKISENSIDIYNDANLTQPLTYTSTVASKMANGWMAYAETCPDPNTVDTSWAFEDSGLGTHAAPLVRCITVRLKSEPCSEWSSSATESANYPCNANPSNTRSMLHRIKVGDGFFDTRDAFGGEFFAVLKKTLNSENSIDVTLERWYGDLAGNDHPSAPPCGIALACNPYPFNKEAGWSLLQGSLYIQYAFDITNPTTPIQFTTGIGHIDMGPGLTPGNVSVPHEYTPLSADSIWNVPALTAFRATPTYLHNDLPVWANDKTRPTYSLLQNYTQARQVPGLAEAVDFNWSFNWAAMNPGAGCNPNCQEGVFNRGAMTKVRGTTYDLGNTTTIVFKIAPFGTVDGTTVKLFQIMVVNGVHMYLQDKSGPGSVITDADLNHYCVALKAGECRPNSTSGDVFVAIRGQLDDGWCISSNATRPAPCAVVVPPYGGWAVQMRMNPLTMDGGGMRRLTLGFHAPMEHGDYSNIGMTPDAKWGLYASEPIHGHAKNGSTDSQSWWLVKLPPWPSTDTNNRMGFVPVPVTLAGSAGDRIRVAFGYAEDGDPASLYCTTRQEKCWTSATATTSNPFLFDGETQQKTTCDSGCIVKLPAIPGRTLFYQVERSNGSNVTLGPLQSTPVR